MTEKRDIKALSHTELQKLFEELDQPRFRTKQVEEWLYARGCLSFDDMSSLPKSLRENLDSLFFISHLYLITRQDSIDGTRKYLFQLSDGSCIETVGIPSEDESRLTVCFSSQVGCPMGCSFCATGQSGYTRNLTAGEMYDQVLYVANDFNVRVSNVVCMGQGEPFLNYDAVLEALRRLNSHNGLEIGARHITVSTCGLIDGIRCFSNEPEQYTLAISLHSAIQRTRDSLMPGVKNISLDELKTEIKRYGDITKRRPSLEYAPIKGINDDNEHIDALIDFCHGMLCHVNLIPLNPIDENSDSPYLMSPSPRIHEFEKRLTAHGIDNSIRRSRGADIDGACGQLRNSQLNKVSSE